MRVSAVCCVLSVYGLVWLCNVYGVMMLQYCWLPSTYTGRTSGALQTEQIFEQTTHLAQLQCSNKWTSNTMHRRLSRDSIIGEKMDDRTLSITLNCLQCSDFIINDRSDQFSLFMRVSVRVCLCVCVWFADWREWRKRRPRWVYSFDYITTDFHYCDQTFVLFSCHFSFPIKQTSSRSTPLS